STAPPSSSACRGRWHSRSPPAPSDRPSPPSPAASLEDSSRLLCDTRAVGRLAGALLPDLVADRGNAPEVLRDRHPVGPRHVLVAGRGAVDHLTHEAARHVTVRLVAGA